MIVPARERIDWAVKTVGAIALDVKKGTRRKNVP